MTPLRLFLGAGLALVLAYPASSQPAAKPATTAAAAPAVEPAALQALARMTAYLSTLTAFDIKADTSMDIVMNDGQKLKLDGANRYVVRRPNGFVVDVTNPWKARRLVYDGKSLTLVAPELGYYATVEAPGTIRETLDAASDRYDLHIPLQDLFRWTDPSRTDAHTLTAGMLVGPGKVDGVDCDHYAFREGEVDWQIWIRKGDKPIPLKVVIVDRTDLSNPQFEAKLTWNESPQVTADTFTFRPATGAMPIKLSTLKPE